LLRVQEDAPQLRTRRVFKLLSPCQAAGRHLRELRLSKAALCEGRVQDLLRCSLSWQTLGAATRILKEGHRPPRHSLWVAQLALPDHHVVPPKSPKGAAVSTIACLVRRKLREPVVQVGAGSKRSTAVMRMPETPVNEDHLPSTREHYVRRPWQIPPVQTEAVACLVEH
jgi:hypothetical protein